LNEGSEQKGTYRMFLDAWKIGQENGIANLIDFGESDLSSTRWVSGYDRYVRIMQNRVEAIDSFEITDANSLRKMKQWLYDHGNGAISGGLLLFNAYMYGTQEVAIASGAEAGKTLIKYWGANHDSSSLHAMAIVGYNDSVQFDFNGDKKFTNTLDISSSEGSLAAKDGKVDMADWEVGAFKLVNSWGTSWGDMGFAYAPYRSLFISFENGGILNNHRLYYLTVKKDYKPKMAFKASLTDGNRATIALSVGVASDPLASGPSKLRSFEREFAYAGGEFPMCGQEASSSIEIGLDVSDLLDSIGGVAYAKFFLVVDSKAPGGFIDSLSLMDYTSGALVQTKSSQTNVAIASGLASAPARTCVGVAWNAAGVLQPRSRTFSRGIISIEKRNGSLCIRVPGDGVKKVAFLNARGVEFPFVRYNVAGEWIAVKNALPSGICFVKVVTTNGKTFIRKIIGNGF
jgi:hypothetical protein